MPTGSPIVPDRDQSIRSAIRKYTRPDPLLAGEYRRATPAARSGLKRLDADRLARGQKALTQPQSAVGLRAASTGDTYVGKPNQSMVGDTIRNVTELIGGLPRLPAAIGGEILDLPKAPKLASEGIADANNLGEAIGNVANVPGVRMIPGSFIASQFRTGGPGVKGITDDPLFSVLDVLPYAGKAARSMPSVKLAQSTVDAAGTGERVGAFSTAARFKAQPRTTPVSPRVTTPRGATVRNALEPTRLGRAMENTGASLRAWKPGQTATQTFGAGAMDATQRAARVEAEMNIPRYATDATERQLIELRGRTNEAATRAKEAGVSDARVAQITEDMKLGQLDDTTLTPAERAYVADARKIRGEIESIRKSSAMPDEQLVEVELPLPSGGTTRELVIPKVAKNLTEAQARAQSARTVATIHEAATGSRTFTMDEGYRTTVELADAAIPVNVKLRAARALVASMEAQGFRAVNDLLPKTKAGRIRLPKDKAALDDALRGIEWDQGGARLPIDDIRRSLASQARTDPTISRLVGLIDAKQYAKAATLSRSVAKRKKFTGGLDWTTITDDLAAYGRQERTAATLARENPVPTLTKAQKKLRSAERKAMPARMNDVVGRRIADVMAHDKIPELQAQGAITPQQAAEVAGLIADGMMDYATLPDSVKTVFDGVRREVESTWLQMVDDGLNPEFVHRVPSSRAGQPVRVTGKPVSVTAAKERAYDFGNTVNDVMISLDHQAMELLAKRGYERYVGEMADVFGRDFDSLRAGYTDWARQAVERNPRLNFRNHLDNLMRRDWSEIDVPARVIDGELIPAHKKWLPRDMKGAIDNMAPKDLGVLGKTFDPVMRVFRTALLPLSPRWQIYNIAGNAITTAMENPRAFRHYQRAWKIAKGQVDEADSLANVRGLPQMAGGKAGRELREATQWGRTTDLSSKSGKAVAAWETSAGKFLRRMWDEAGKAGGSVVDRSYAVNEMVDDWFRTMNYLGGESRGLAKGLTKEAAEAQGVAAMRRTAQSWDRLTPMERTVIRNVFPFYSWMKFSLGFVSRFPFDHPLRTSITASLVQAELDDYGTGLPQMFFSLLDITGPAGRFGVKPDEGHSLMLNLEGMNPFKDIGSYATLMGFFSTPFTGDDGDVGSLAAVTSQMNPGVQVFLRGIGVDPAEGTPDLYGGVAYDPITGGLRSKVQFNPLTDTVQSILPQSKIAFDLAGVNRDYQQLVRSNPDAALRRLVSSAGIPVLGRQFDPTVETMKAEVRRLEDLQRTKSDALRTGDLGKLSRYDRLHPLRDKLTAARRTGELERVTAPKTRDELSRILNRADTNQGVVEGGVGVRRSALG